MCNCLYPDLATKRPPSNQRQIQAELLTELFQFEKDRYMQSGIVAWGIGCGEDGNPGVYVDVANLRDWIDDKVVGEGYDPKIYTI